MTTTEWQVTGFNGLAVKSGDTVRIRENGFRGAVATVLWMDESKCEVEIVTGRMPWRTGRRTSVRVWFLETV
jgi:hypothetical protein